MTFHYPNGNPYSYHEGETTKKQAKKKRPVQFGKRGMDFEEAINQSNLYYLSHEIAVIHKKPTPVQIVKVDYPRRSAAVIKEAYFRQASTTDYNGVYQGHYIDFEAKETKNKTSFPFKNFHQHQIDHIHHCLKQGGICFVLLWFSSLNRCFFFSGEKLVAQWNQQKKNGKKSLPLTLIEKEGIELPFEIAPRIPYVNAIDQHLQNMLHQQEKVY
ncbi:Holliday junction resolvase RecU [Enterococcus faecalis]